MKGETQAGMPVPQAVARTLVSAASRLISTLFRAGNEALRCAADSWHGPVSAHPHAIASELL